MLTRLHDVQQYAIVKIRSPKKAIVETRPKYLTIRVSESELAKVDLAADRALRTRSDWARVVVLGAAK